VPSAESSADVASDGPAEGVGVAKEKEGVLEPNEKPALAGLGGLSGGLAPKKKAGVVEVGPAGSAP